MSSCPLSTTEYNYLQKGLNYNKDDANQLEFLATLEAAFKNHITCHRDPRKQTILPQIRRTLKQNPFKAEERAILRNLKKDQNITIIPADND